MVKTAVLDRGRTAFAEHRWSDALEAMTDADVASGLTAEDLERLSTAAFLIGQEDVGIDAATRAHQKFLAAGDVDGAARSAAWLGISLISMGDLSARSAGWLARAGRVIEANDESSAVGGLLLIPNGLGALHGGNAEDAERAFEEAWSIGSRFGDVDVMSLALLGQGQAKIMLGQLQDGLALLDEAMIAVTAGEVASIPSGIIYCSVIGTCHLAHDLRRAQEWTAALDRWCDDRPDLVLFSGQCQMHRSQLLFLRGAWTEALGEARTALDFARRGDRNAIYGAWYQQAEIQRLRGELDAAEASYLEAARTGYEPQPGLSLLRLAQGRTQVAQTLIRRAVDDADSSTRRRLLPGQVEIELAAGDSAAARRAADELATVGTAEAMPMMQAVADHCGGAVLLEEGDAGGALNMLRRALTLWQDLELPFEAARCRVLMAQACDDLGDAELASMERETARTVFAELAATPSLGQVDSPSTAGLADAAGPLTPRETEILRVVATGTTNRAVASELHLSEKTVARHLSNIYAKLGLSSRSAATAYAYEHGLI